MKELFKKIIVILPVALLTLLYLKDHYREEYRHAGARRLMLFALTIFLLYAWMFTSAMMWKQRTALMMLLQSSFFVYLFMVLTLTGYFILFREISVHGWWANMKLRIRQEDHVNLDPFEMFKIYKITDKQVVGNLVMLFPLGIYLPLLYKKLNNFFVVFLVSLLVSLTIECLQLATRFRSADVDDVILNTAGGCIGFLIYRIGVSLLKPAPAPG